MAKDPADRFQSAAEVADLLSRYLAYTADPERVPPPPPVHGVRIAGRNRRAWVWALGAAAASALTVGTLGHLVFWPTEPEPTVAITHAPASPPPRELPDPGELAKRSSPFDIPERSGNLLPTAVGMFGDGRFRLPSTALNSLMRQDREGRWLAVPHGETVAIFDTTTGELVRTLTGHTDRVHAVAFSPDGRHIAAGESAGSVTLYDVTTGAKLRTLPGPATSVRAVAFSPDGTLVAGATTLGVVHVWEVATGRLRSALAGRAAAWCVAFSADGKTVVTGWGDGTVLLFDAATGWEVAALRVGTESVRWLAFHPVGRSLTVGGFGENDLQHLGIWDLATRTEVRRTPGQGQLGGVWRADGRLLATCGATDGTIRLWTADDQPERHRAIPLYPMQKSYLNGLAMSPEGRHLATANPDGTVTILRLAKAGEVFALKER